MYLSPVYSHDIHFELVPGVDSMPNVVMTSEPSPIDVMIFFA